MTPDELKNTLIEQTRTWYILGCEELKITPKELTIDFNLTGSVAGQAIGTRRIRYNLNLAMNNQETFLKRTVPHEVAHLLQVSINPLSPSHGKLWKSIMDVFGIESSRCHSYDVSGNNTGRVKYRFDCILCGDSYHVGVNLKNKIINNSGHHCARCGKKGELIYKP